MTLTPRCPVVSTTTVTDPDVWDVHCIDRRVQVGRRTCIRCGAPGIPVFQLLHNGSPWLPWVYGPHSILVAGSS